MPSKLRDRSIQNKEIKQEQQITKPDETNAHLIRFDHKLAEFEFKLKYLNLKDTSGKEFGRFFPPVRSQLVILDDEGRKFLMIKAGINQISGNLSAFINANHLKPGDIISIEYDREEKSEDGKHILHVKLKQSKSEKAESE